MILACAQCGRQVGMWLKTWITFHSYEVSKNLIVCDDHCNLGNANAERRYVCSQKMNRLINSFLNRLQLEMKIQIEACYIDHHHDIGSKVYLKLCLHLAFWDMSQFRIRVLIKVSICVSGHELGFKSKVGNQLQWGVAHDHIKGRLRSAWT